MKSVKIFVSRALNFGNRFEFVSGSQKSPYWLFKVGIGHKVLTSAGSENSNSSEEVKKISFI